MYFLIGDDGKEYGPVDTGRIREWISQGRANAQTKVRTEDSEEWIFLSEVPEFARMLASPPRLVQPPSSTPAKTSRLAIASVICALLGLVTGITSGVGVVLGLIAYTRIINSSGRLKSSRLALTGIILSIVTFFGFCVIQALMEAKHMAQEINCTNNLKYLGLAARMYAGDNGYPSATNWCDLLNPQVGKSNYFVCPAGHPKRSSYAYNAKLSGMKEDDVNPRTVMFFESDQGWNASGGPSEMVTNRHYKIVVVCFADGSVEHVLNTNLNSLRWNP